MESSNHIANTWPKLARLGEVVGLARLVKTLRSKLSLHPVFLDIGVTAVVEFTAFVAALLVVSLLSRTLGPVLLGEYLLIRRVYAWLHSGTNLGMGAALTRYIAHAVDKPVSERAGYFVAAVVSAGTVTTAVVLLLNSARKPFALWLFGSPQMTHLLIPLSLMLAGAVANDMVYAYYRGHLNMKRANALQFLSYSLAPIVTVLALAGTGSVALITGGFGVLTLVFAGLLTLPILPDLAQRAAGRFRFHTRELLRYGVPRVPGAFGLGALFAFGPMIAAHYLPLSEVSYLLLGMTLLMGVSSSAHPLGLVLLSKVSVVLAQNRLAEVRVYFAHLQAAVLELYVFLCLQLIVFADVLVRVWVGPKLLPGVFVIRLVLLATPFFLLFVSQRSIIDAATVKPYNTYNICIATAVFLILTAVAVKTVPFRFLLEGIAVTTILGIFVLAWLTNRAVRELYGLQVEWRRSVGPVLLGVVLGGTSLALHWAHGFQTGIGQFLLIELATGAFFLFLLKLSGSSWLPFFLSLALAQQPRAEGESAD